MNFVFCGLDLTQSRSIVGIESELSCLKVDGGAGQISDSTLSHYRDLTAFFIDQRIFPLLSSGI